MIDCHCHILPEEIVSNIGKYAEKDRYFGSLAKTKEARFVTGADLLRDMAESSLDKAVVFGFAFVDTGICRLINDYVADLCKRYPHNMIGMAVLSPESPGALKEAERCLSMGLSGFGELFPAGHGYSLNGQKMKKLASLCSEANVPLLIHVNEQVGHKYPGKGTLGPKDAWEFAIQNPDVTVIFAHLGGGLPFFYYMPEVRALKKVYYDTAAQPFLYRPQVYSAMKHSGALERIFLGSDYPLLNWKRYVRELLRSGLCDDDINKVVERNAEKVFGEFFMQR